MFLQRMVRKMEALESRQLASPVHKNPDLERLYELCEKKSQVQCVLAVWCSDRALCVVDQ